MKSEYFFWCGLFLFKLVCVLLILAIAKIREKMHLVIGLTEVGSMLQTLIKILCELSVIIVVLWNL